MRSLASLPLSLSLSLPLSAGLLVLSLSARGVPAPSSPAGPGAVSAKAASAGAEVPSPSAFLGIPVGADRTLADYRQISDYFRALDAASDRVEVVSFGRSTLGKEMLMAVVSSPENLARQGRIREIARRLADPRGLAPAEAESLVKEGKAVVLVTCGIHASEIGSTQMAMEWAYGLATATDPETLRRLSEVVLLLVPSINPDGNVMEVEWYRKYLGTRWEGGRMPWLYHPYVGHDDNRDWYMLTQAETKALTRVLYHDWFPQVFLDEHQMGPSGPRMFVPPYAEPMDPDIHPLVFREANLIGSTMALRLEQAGKKGVIYGYAFDASWPGGTKNTAWWKNVTGLLTEVASPRLATPVEVPPTELAGGAKGLVTYTAQANFPSPWPGGAWRLRDVMDYERIASDALLESVADHREDVLRDMLERARATIAAAAPGEAYRIPAAQRDAPTARLLAALMREHNVDVLANANGDVYVPLAQPYGRFVREMMEPQRYPEVKLVAGKEIVAPYDVTAWSLPLMMGVSVEKAPLPEGLAPWTPPAPIAAATEGGAVFAIRPDSPERAKVLNAALRSKGTVSVLPVERDGLPAGTAFLDAPAAAAAAGVAGGTGVAWTARKAAPRGTVLLKAPRVGLYKPWAASMDEGWTRFLLERYGFAPVSLDNAAVQAGRLRERFDVIVLPDVPPDVLSTGRRKQEEGEPRYVPSLPPEYTGGLEREGARALRDFVDAGGTLVALASACDWVTGEFEVPVRNVLAKSRPEEFRCPGTLLNVSVAPGHPVTWGLPRQVAIFLEEPMAFQTSLPGAELSRWVLAAYPDDARDVLASGWIRGEERLTRRAAAVATTFGKGKLVLLGFRPQYRAQTHATFPFLFDALYWSVLGV